MPFFHAVIDGIMQTMKIRLIIFDLDGTLADTSIDITNALNYAVEPYNFKKMTVEKTISMVGGGLTKLVEKLLGDDMADLKPEVLRRFLEYYSEHLTVFTVPYPEVAAVLAELGSFKKAVISNKRENLSRRLLEDLGLARHFDIIMGSDSVDEKKPSPKPILHVLETLSVGPDEAVIVGDSPYDIEAGKAAGIITIGATYGFRDRSFLAEADYLINSFEEIKARLEEIGVAS